MTSIFVLAPVCWLVKPHLARTAKCDLIQIGNLHIFTDVYHNAPKCKKSDLNTYCFRSLCCGCLWLNDFYLDIVQAVTKLTFKNTTALDLYGFSV
jgi:hypothetical protein